MEPGLRVSSQAGREKEKEPFCDMTHDERFSAGGQRVSWHRGMHWEKLDKNR